MITWRSFWVILISMGFVGSMTFSIVRYCQERDRAGLTRLRLQAMDEFCGKVRIAMHDDARQLAGQDLTKRSVALARFYDSNEVYHGVESILVCIPDLRDHPSHCSITADFACLSKAATDYEARIK